MLTRYLDSWKESLFPNLTRAVYRVTSEATARAKVRYNCIAHAMNENNLWWWPDGDGIVDYEVHWLPEVAKECTIDAFVAVFRTKGFVPCDDLNIELEPGYEKVAIYCNAAGEPTHAARQLPSGAWTSKLGDWEDIEHETLACLESEDYGTVGKVLKRAIG